MGYFPVRYDSRVINYDRRGFIRLATGLCQGLNLLCPISLGWMGEQSGANASWSVASTVLPIVKSSLVIFTI